MIACERYFPESSDVYDAARLLSILNEYVFSGSFHLHTPSSWGRMEYMCAKEGMDVYLQPKYDALFLYVHRATS